MYCATAPRDIMLSQYDVAWCDVSGQQFKTCDRLTVHQKLDQTGYRSQKKRRLKHQKCLITLQIVGLVINVTKLVKISLAPCHFFP